MNFGDRRGANECKSEISSSAAISGRSRSATATEMLEGVAGWAAARLTRACASQAFLLNGRATTTTDLIGVLHPAFNRLYGAEKGMQEATCSIL